MINLDDLKNYLGIDTDIDDSLLNRVLKDSIATIANYTNREFRYNEYTEIIRDASTIFPKNTPIDEIISIEVDGVKVRYMDLLGDYIQLYKRGDVIKITYRGGYKVIPDDIKFIALDIAGAKYKLLKEDGDIVSSRSEGGTSVSFKTYENILEKHYNNLDKYRYFNV